MNSKKIHFLEDEKDGDEIVIKGAIKKSSLNKVSEYLKNSDEDNDDDKSSERKPHPKQSSMHYFSVEDIIEEEDKNGDDSSSQEHLENDTESSHQSQSIFT